MSLRKKLNLGWNGKEAELLVTLEIVSRIEQKVSPSWIQSQFAKGHPPLAETAKLLSLLLAEAGITATQDDIYYELHYSEDATALYALITDVLTSFIPQQKKKDSGKKLPKSK